nr:hypothetical protein [Tanacetum cinerariifolium]
VVERRNKTLIVAARTMLADAKLPVTFWAEVVNTACYVQNRVLVNKSHNKTPNEFFNGRLPAIGFLKPFGCHVMILNTLDNLGKFEEKGDEEENLHVEFLENKAIEQGVGPNWLFDIDSLTKSMNYMPVDAAQVPSFQTLPSFPQQYPCCEDCGGISKADHCQPPQYTVNHPIFNVYNHLLNSQTKLMEQVTSMCEMFGQFIQRKHEEEQAANARYWKIPACCDDDDNHNFAITPNKPVDSPSMGDEHLNTVSAMKSDEFIKSSVKNLVPNPSEFEGENGCDVPACFTTFSNVLFDADYEFYSKFVYENSNADIESFSPSPISIEDSDSFMEEIDLSSNPDDPMPPGIEEDDYDSERDILIFEELLDNYSLSLPEK